MGRNGLSPARAITPGRVMESASHAGRVRLGRPARRSGCGWPGTPGGRRAAPAITSALRRDEPRHLAGDLLPEMAPRPGAGAGTRQTGVSLGDSVAGPDA